MHNKLFINVLCHFGNWHLRIEIFIKLSVTLFIMVNSSLTQITLSAVVKVHITTLFKCDCSGFRHLQFLHSKIPFKLTKKVGHIMGKNPQMMCPTKKFYIFNSKKFSKVLKHLYFLTYSLLPELQQQQQRSYQPSGCCLRR